jgi:hypothetical protein
MEPRSGPELALPAGLRCAPAITSARTSGLRDTVVPHLSEAGNIGRLDSEWQRL